MGSNDSKVEQISNYYLFQKKIKDHLNKEIINKESFDIEEGFLIHPDWIKDWKNMIDYNTLFLFFCSIDIKDKLEEKQKQYINQMLGKNQIYIELDTSFIVKSSNFRSIKEDVITEDNLENFIDKKTYDKLKINEKNTKEKIRYIFKKQMIIFFFDNCHIIKLFIHSLCPFKDIDKPINIKYIFFNDDIYKQKVDYFKKNESNIILNELVCLNIFDIPLLEFVNNKGEKTFRILNEEKNKNTVGIKNPNEINFDLVNLSSCRGLDNVGATCYMNATLQCLANIKPLTEYLLNKNKYSALFQNIEMCTMTLQYAQVLIGLFCNPSRIGSYRPINFKKIISEYNPLFEGVQANDSKDLIIFLLEILNDELVKNHNKIHNINYSQNQNQSQIKKKIDTSNEKEVFNHFTKEFKKNYCSEIGFNLCGFQKGIFHCQTCYKKTFNYNIFNILIFSLEATSNYFNLSNNMTMIPVINFDHCFRFLCKDEMFQDTYCQNCRRIGISKYQESIYYMPNYLIIILNRGKGNIFNCQIQIPEIFNPCNYVQKDKNASFSLIGVVSHLGESGMGGHFIAFCKSYKDGIWRFYNDSLVTECQNDYLTKGTPYILFYKKENQQIQNCVQANMNNMNIMNNIFNNNSNLLNNNNYNQINMFNNNFQQNMNMNNLQQNMNMLNGNSFQQNMNMNSNNFFMNNNFPQFMNNINF